MAKAIESICGEFKDDLAEFQKWISSHRDLPQNIEKLLLLRYLKVCNFNCEKAGKLLTYNLELRRQYPHIFFERNLKSEKLQKAMRTLQCCPLPLYTAGKNRVTIFRLIDQDPHNYDVVDNFKLFFMMSDVRFVTSDAVGLSEGEIGIMDFSGFSFRHFLKIATNLPTLRLYLKYVQEAVPFRIHQNHFVNCSSTLTKVMTLIRPFVKKELYDVMHFHTSGYESLYEHVPRDALPFEYGGDAGKLDDFYDEWIRIVESHTEYLHEDSNWKLSE